MSWVILASANRPAHRWMSTVNKLGDESSGGVCCVVFGAAVKPGGVPSGTLRRRVEGAFSVGGRSGRYFVTGGIGDHPPAEAEVMTELLQAYGVPIPQIIVDTDAIDTLSSAKNLARLIDLDGNCSRIVVCTSRYHMPRCRMLLRCLGIPTLSGTMPSDWPHLGVAKLSYFHFREFFAYPYDLVSILFSRHFLRYRSDKEGR